MSLLVVLVAALMQFITPFSLRAQFPLSDDFNPNANNQVYCAVSQPDGKMVVGGAFTTVDGQTRNRLARLHADGTVDAMFNPNAGNSVNCVVVQTDGKILVGGAFTSLSGQTRNRLARLHADGTLDMAFDPSPGSGVYCLALQPDGRILVGGDFTTLCGQARTRIGRLNPDGTLDTSFNPGANGGVYSLVVQPDGKILAGGVFTTLGGQTRNRLARLNSDGTLDAGFNPNAGGTVNCLLLQPDGGLVIGGAFTTLGGQPCNRLARVDGTGQLDTAFDPNAGGTVTTLALQTDGRILVGGAFTTLGGQTRNRLARLHVDGSLDTTFDPAPNAAVYSLCLQPDGRILVGGMFTSIAGQTRNRLARLTNTDAATESLTCDGNRITWLRSGSGPEVERVAFEVWTNGTTWVALGEGEWVAGGWQRTGLALPTGATIRARGEISGGQYNGSRGLMETIIGTPLVLESPMHSTNSAGTTATLTVRAGGTEPLAYQWLKAGVPMSDGGKVSGVTSNVLTLTNVFGPDGGGYSVSVSNVFGCVTSAVAVLTVIDPVITSPPMSLAVTQGQNATFTVQALGTDPLGYQWRKDGVPLARGTNATLIVTNAQGADAGAYDVAVSNGYGTATSVPALLTVNVVTVDGAFGLGANSTVHALALQPEQTVVVAGDFTVLGWPRNRLARFNADGSLDMGYDPNAGGNVYSVAVQPDGKLIVGGAFTTMGGETRLRLARLHSDGTLDTAFNPGASNTVQAVLLQPDGRILVGGDFTGIAGHAYRCLARLNADGSLDTGFTPVPGGSVLCLALQPDGQVIVAGTFTTLGGQTRNRVGRLDSNGALDTTFNPNANGTIYCVLVQPDGRIVLGGDFTTVGGQPRNRLARLLPDGSVDADFDPNSGGSVYSLTLQTDDTLLVGGTFTALGGQARNRLARLHPNGALDLTFNPGAGGSVCSLAVQSDGRIWVGGIFTTLGGQTRHRIARLNNSEPATQSLTRAADTITWLRGGSSPEVWRTVFEASTNSITWFPLGDGTRISGGWQLGGVQLPSSATVRARGQVTGGRYCSSGGWVETIIGAPVVVCAPQSRTNDLGTVATFSVVAGGAEPFSYRWLKESVPLSDGGKVSGVTTPLLTLSNVFGPDGGAYAVCVSNNFGCVTSAVATFTVIEPVIATQPTNQFAELGGEAVFTLSVLGTAPFTYQWRKDGTQLAGATAPTLRLTNAKVADAGWYDVVVSNAYGVATSAAALLTVNATTVDGNFDPGASDYVYCAVPQRGERVVVGGDFRMLAKETCYRLGQLDLNGTLDTAFSPGPDNSVLSVLAQPDGKLVVGGWFTNLAGQARRGLARLNPDGSLDTGFQATIEGGQYAFVQALALQADGKILVGGRFNMLAGQTRTNLGRLNLDGSFDPTFNTSADSDVRSFALHPDGRIVVGGGFTRLGGQSRRFLGRLSPDGSLDTNFSPTYVETTIHCVLVQPDDKVLVSGTFNTLCWQPRAGLGRLHPDGTLDADFNPTGAGGAYSLAIQADGKILAGLRRLHPDGATDITFNPEADRWVFSLALQADGRMLVGGDFRVLNGQPRQRIGRLINTAPATESLTHVSDTITWLRGGTSPEVYLTTFEFSTNGTDWSALGQGERIPGGWQLGPVTLPANASLRARGYTTCGQYNGSGWVVETLLGAPTILEPPLSRTNSFATTASFTVRAGGTEPLGYQWLKAGIPLSDGGNISGATSPLLTVSNVFGADSAAYAVRVTNTSGSVTSAVAFLTVLDPLMVTNPVSQSIWKGMGVSFAAGATGTSPLHYQWLKDGAPVLWSTGTTLTVTNAQGSDAGSYVCVASNQFGTATSRVALLTVNTATVDLGFNPGVEDTWLEDPEVYTLAMDTSGKALVGGWFDRLAGRPCNNIGRLNTDGSLDAGFAPQTNGCPFAFLMLPNGQIVAGGDFTWMGGQRRHGLARLNPDGTVDASFNPGSGGTVNALALQPDNRIVVAGDFPTMAGQPRNNLARLSADGTLDPDFNASASGDAEDVFALALQPDGKILVGGAFTTLNGQPRLRLGRLNPDGTLDAEFDPGVAGDEGNPRVYALAVQADGKTLVGGQFTTLAGQPRARLGRLNPDGTLDVDFNPQASGQHEDYTAVLAIALQADGKILVGGNFTTLAGQTRLRLGRLLPDGAPDLTFNPGVSGRDNPEADPLVWSLSLQHDGSLLVAGAFNRLAGLSCSCLGRLQPAEPATQSLTFDGAAIRWWRGGSSPEVWRTTFESSLDGTVWSFLGAGSRVPGGWQLGGLSLPAGSWIRARGYVSGGRYSSSAWLVESLLTPGGPTPLRILVNDGWLGVRSNRFGFNVSGVAGHRVVIESSSNLTHWLPLRTNTLESGPWYFSDPHWGAALQRYYRCRLSP